MTGTHPDIERLAKTLTRDDIALFSYDPRGHGDSGGRYTMGHEEAKDVAAAVQAARGLAPSVVLSGTSTGAIASLRYLAAQVDQGRENELEGIAGVIAVSCPSRWHRPHGLRAAGGALLTRTRLGRLLAGRLMDIQIAAHWDLPEAPLGPVTRISVPIAIVHGMKDPYLPVTEAVELFAHAREPKRLFLPPHMGHGLDPAADQALVEALCWVVRRAPSPARAPRATDDSKGRGTGADRSRSSARADNPRSSSASEK